MKIDRHDLSLYINVSVAYLSWFSAISHALDTSLSWLEPVLSFGHWEPNVAALISFVLKVHWHWESPFAVGEEVGKVLEESMYLLMLIMNEVVLMVKIIVERSTMLLKIVSSSWLVMVYDWCIEMILSNFANWAMGMKVMCSSRLVVVNNRIIEMVIMHLSHLSTVS